MPPPAKSLSIMKPEDTETLFTITGRPARKSAGRKLAREGYVDTKGADLDLSDSSEYDEDFPKKGWTQKPIAKARALSPVQDLNFPDSSPECSPPPTLQSSNRVAVSSIPENVSLTFNVPKNHSGPFVVNLNLRDLGLSPSASPSKQTKTKRTSVAKRGKSSSKGGQAHQQNLGFNDLPPEIRNIIYRELFGSRKELNFARPDFAHSGQFLRTCKQVLAEAAPILYGTHSFKLVRDNSLSGTYWKKPWTEVGYRNVRRWLTDIGPLNVSLLRDIEIELEDGIVARYETYYQGGSAAKEQSRYVHDSDLIECIKLLAKYGQLRTLTLLFRGKKNLSRRDDRFVHELRKVRADSYVQKPERVQQPYMYHHGNIAKLEEDLASDLRKRLPRQTKLYKEDKKQSKAKEKKNKHAHLYDSDTSISN